MRLQRSCLQPVLAGPLRPSFFDDVSSDEGACSGKGGVRNEQSAPLHRDRCRRRRGQQFAVLGEAMRHEAEHEILGCLVAPAGERSGFKGVVQGAVDVDCAQAPAGPREFLAARQSGRIEIVASGRRGPAADTYVNAARLSRLRLCLRLLQAHQRVLPMHALWRLGGAKS